MKKEIRTVVRDSELGIEAYRFKGAMRFPNHFHEYYVIGFLEAGDVTMLCNAVEYAFHRGDMLLLNPGDSHTCAQTHKEEMDYRCVNIPPERMCQAAAEISGSGALPRLPGPVIPRGDLVSSLKELHAAVSKGEDGFRKEEVFLLLLAQLTEERAPERPAEQGSDGVQDACGYIDEHYAGHVCLSDLCARAGMSRWHLIRAFTKEKGISPYSYLETVRIAAAQKMLANGTPPIEVSLLAGFSDQSHFTNYFKKFIGLTPKQYANIFRQS